MFTKHAQSHRIYRCDVRVLRNTSSSTHQALSRACLKRTKTMEKRKRETTCAYLVSFVRISKQYAFSANNHFSVASDTCGTWQCCRCERPADRPTDHQWTNSYTYFILLNYLRKLIVSTHTNGAANCISAYGKRVEHKWNVGHRFLRAFISTKL